MTQIRTFLIALLFVLAGCDEAIIIAPDAILPDGSVYKGDTLNGKFHGQGTLAFATDGFYKGEFRDGVFHGRGVLQDGHGNRYEGEFNKGKVTGTFNFIGKNSSFTYDGEMLNGVLHGRGKLQQEDSTYEGEFSDGLYNGEGKITYSDDSFYEGSFKHGKYSGKGKFVRDDTVYEGIYVDGVLEGKGRYVDYEGNEYVGETENWSANGEGVLTDTEGNVYKGNFDHGFLSGEGEKIGADGSHYRGEFSYSEYDGKGALTNSDGSTYVGNFSYGQYHGEGVLTSLAVDGGPSEITQGKWANGDLEYNLVTGESRYDESDLALQNHQSLLQAQLSKIEASEAEKSNVYFLGIAGDGKQSVFRREVEFINQVVEERYNTKGRSMLLINHHNSASEYALATERSITLAINSISEKMNHENDILFLYMTSHGSKDHEFYLGHDSIELSNLPAKKLSKILTDANVKWKVVFISACYAGGFIKPLQSETTLIVTAADANSRSFGCSEESEMTYFGKAFFKEVFAKNADISIAEAFAQAEELIDKWEAEEDKESSNPMISAPLAIVEKLAMFDDSIKKARLD